jgi:hypothetical protein
MWVMLQKYFQNQLIIYPDKHGSLCIEMPTLLISIKPMQKRFWYLQWGASLYLVRSCTIAHLPFLKTHMFDSQDEALAYRDWLGLS